MTLYNQSQYLLYSKDVTFKIICFYLVIAILPRMINASFSSSNSRVIILPEKISNDHLSWQIHSRSTRQSEISKKSWSEFIAYKGYYFVFYYLLHILFFHRLMGFLLFLVIRWIHFFFCNIPLFIFFFSFRHFHVDFSNNFCKFIWADRKELLISSLNCFNCICIYFRKEERGGGR